MNAFRIHITSWTASFRYPNLISGFQPTLDVPPISTILGLINAAAGYYQHYQQLHIGYYFRYDIKAVDLETIYQMDSDKGRPTNNAKSNVISREFLFNNSLHLYLKDEKIVDFFKRPHYPLLLGRLNDLASVAEIKAVQLQESEETVTIKGQIIPFIPHHLPGQIQALPKYFTDTIPRNNLGTEPYSIISHDARVKTVPVKAYHDADTGNDIYFHELNFSLHE
jgi:CRISPR-associated protein Cas5t